MALDNSSHKPIARGALGWSTSAVDAAAKRGASQGGIPANILQLPERGGRGVLAGNGLLTAAHSINSSTNGEMVLSTLGAAWAVCGPGTASSQN
jgi:hypothetical protein